MAFLSRDISFKNLDIQPCNTIKTANTYGIISSYVPGRGQETTFSQYASSRLKYGKFGIEYQNYTQRGYGPTFKMPITSSSSSWSIGMLYSCTDTVYSTDPWLVYDSVYTGQTMYATHGPNGTSVQVYITNGTTLLLSCNSSINFNDGKYHVMLWVIDGNRNNTYFWIDGIKHNGTTASLPNSNPIGIASSGFCRIANTTASTPLWYMSNIAWSDSTCVKLSNDPYSIFNKMQRPQSWLPRAGYRHPVFNNLGNITVKNDLGAMVCYVPGISKNISYRSTYTKLTMGTKGIQLSCTSSATVNGAIYNDYIVPETTSKTFSLFIYGRITTLGAGGTLIFMPIVSGDYSNGGGGANAFLLSTDGGGGLAFDVIWSTASTAAAGPVNTVYAYDQLSIANKFSADGLFHMWEVRKSETSVTAYIDGVQIGTLATTSTVLFGKYAPSLGGGGYAGNPSSICDLKFVFLSNKYLTDAQSQQIRKNFMWVYNPIPHNWHFYFHALILNGFENVGNIGALVPYITSFIDSTPQITTAYSYAHPELSTTPTGQNAITSFATFTDISLTLIVSGLSSTTNIGALSVSSSIQVSGSPILALLGSFQDTISHQLSGLFATSSYGTILPGIGIIGLQLSSSYGSMSPSITIPVSGKDLTLYYSNINVEITLSVYGSQLSTYFGSSTFTESLQLSGLQLTTLSGTLYPTISAVIQSNYATSNVGTILSDISLTLISSNSLNSHSGILAYINIPHISITGMHCKFLPEIKYTSRFTKEDRYTVIFGA